MTVYFITDGTYIKIGRTNNLKQRKRVLETGNASTLEVLYTLENVPANLESLLHEMAEKYHYKGEWYYRDCMIPILRHPWYSENIVDYNTEQRISLASGT